jgi:hypothetical protein
LVEHYPNQQKSHMEPSPELEEFFELMKRIYLRLEAEGKWDEALATLRADRERQESGIEAFESSHG